MKSSLLLLQGNKDKILKNEYEKTKNNDNEINKEINARKNNRVQIKDLESQINILKQQLDDQKKEIAEKNNLLGQERVKKTLLLNIENSIKYAENRLHSIQNEISNTNLILMNKSILIDQKHAKIRELNDQIEKKERELIWIDRDLQYKKASYSASERNNYTQQIKGLEEENKKLKKRLLKLIQEKDDLSEKNNYYSSLINVDNGSKEINQVDLLKKEIEEKKKELEHLENEICRFEKKLDGKKLTWLFRIIKTSLQRVLKT